MEQNFPKNFQKKPFAALFLSGTGTNAERLLEIQRDESDPSWIPSVLITDRPETSAARALSQRFGIPLVEHDIAEFYRDHGLETVTIRTDRGMGLREAWTDELRAKLAPFEITFGLLAGFTTLCNINRDFPCLNVHPGDLTIEENGQRIFAGLHYGPIERAILRGDRTLRSSVILTQPVTAGGSEMDAGPVLGISEPVELELYGHTLPEYEAVFASRAKKTPKEYASDLLRATAKKNIETLKRYGDWTVFPAAVNDYASGAFSFGADGSLYYHNHQVRTVEYPRDGGTPREVPVK